MPDQEVALKPMTVPQRALLAYMEYISEERWAAGWMANLHLRLRDDEVFQWLVAQAGGYFVHKSEAAGLGGERLGWAVGARDVVFVRGMVVW